jgi:hypothetical protein
MTDAVGGDARDEVLAQCGLERLGKRYVQVRSSWAATTVLMAVFLLT